MPFTIPEALSDLPELLSIVQKISDGVTALPTPKTAKAYADLAAEILPDLGKLIDTIEAQVKS